MENVEYVSNKVKKKRKLVIMHIHTLRCFGGCVGSNDVTISFVNP